MAFSAGSAVVGLYSANRASKSAKRQQNIQRDANQRSLDLEEQALDLQRQQLERWESIYGKAEENLGDYYNSLDSEEYKIQALQAEKDSLQATQLAIRKQFSQSNLGGNAAEQLALAGSTLNSNRRQADIALNADDVIAQRQANFVAAGRGLQSSAVGGLTNTLNSASNRSFQTAANAEQSAAAFRDKRDTAVGSILNTGINVAKKFNGSIESLFGSLGG